MILKFKNVEGNEYDITHLSNNIQLSTSIGTLGAALSFNLARNIRDVSFKVTEKIKVGDMVTLFSEKNLFSGIVLTLVRNKFNISIQCLDFCFYLNKNKILKQFEGIAASTAISQLLNEMGAPIGKIASMATTISKIYEENTIAEIIQDVLTQVFNETGIEYILEFEEGKFNVVKFKEVEVAFKFKEVNIASSTESIVEMKNQILVTSNEQETMEILAIAKDDESISRYGSLQDIVRVAPNQNESNVRNIANQRLKVMNKIVKTTSIQGFGNDSFKAGRIIEINNKEFALNSKFLIKSCVHTWKKANHLVRLEVEAYD